VLLRYNLDIALDKLNPSALCLQKRGKSCIFLSKEVKLQDIAMTEDMVEIRLKINKKAPFRKP
jgi:hypothetical protein